MGTTGLRRSGRAGQRPQAAGVPGHLFGHPGLQDGTLARTFKVLEIPRSWDEAAAGQPPDACSPPAPPALPAPIQTLTDTRRAYQTSHPWISFTINLKRASPRLWALLGQAVAFCEQLSGAVLPPAAVRELHTLYLVKGVKATTAIENNTLTEEQVGQVLDGTLDLPPSQAYLGQEVINILDAVRDIHGQIEGGTPPRLTPQWIGDANRAVLAGLEDQLADGVVPGEVPAFPIGVGRYRAAPREDCGYLLDRLCRWLDEDDVPGPGAEPLNGDRPGRPVASAQATASVFQDPDRRRIAQGVLKATLAHLYIAWIHPFGDGNGRTARLIEFMLLARAGVPFPSAHLMSNHFNRTRSRY